MYKTVRLVKLEMEEETVPFNAAVYSRLSVINIRLIWEMEKR